MEPQVRILSEARDPLVGRVIHDRYRVLKRIGKGGMGIVYLAEHVLIGRKLAIKTLSERAFASEEMLARFQREAMAAAAVGDDHVIDVTDMGRLEDGTCYIAMEYLEGIDVACAIASQGCFSVERAVDVVCQLCDALIAVHGAGIVHRDLKPENLFLIDSARGGDFVKVLDFGICKLVDEQSLTGTGASLGTPQFMAPEQFEGSARVDARADLYATGAILYYLLTGREPFEGDSLQQIFMRVSSQPAPRVSQHRAEVPAALDDVVQRALQKRPEERFGDAAALKAALLASVVAENSPSQGVARAPGAEPVPQAAPASCDDAPVPAPPRLRALYRLTLGALLLVCGGLFAWQLTRPATVATRPTEDHAAASRPRERSSTQRPPAPTAIPASEETTATTIALDAPAETTPATPVRHHLALAARPRARARGLPPSDERSSASSSQLGGQEQPAAATGAEAAPSPLLSPAAVETVPPAEPAIADAVVPQRARLGYELPRRELKPVFDDP